MIINGKKIAEEILLDLKQGFEKIQYKNLGVFFIGNDPATNSFVKIKQKSAEKLGINFNLFSYDKNIDEEDFIVDFIKKQKTMDGVIIQLPLPINFNQEKILSLIDKNKDVDILNPKNILNFKNDKLHNLFPPVAGAVNEVIKSANYDLKHKNILILGKGKLTGQPLMDLFIKQKITFNMIDSQTLKSERIKKISQADLIISGTGIPNLISAEDIKNNVFLIDMGTSNFKKNLTGDINKNCTEKSSFFSQTPGGIGPITVSILYRNFLNLLNKKD